MIKKIIIILLGLLIIVSHNIIAEEKGSLEIDQQTMMEENTDIKNYTAYFQILFYDKENNFLSINLNDDKGEKFHNGSIISLKNLESFKVVDIPLETQYFVKQVHLHPNLKEKDSYFYNGLISSTNSTIVVRNSDKIQKNPTNLFIETGTIFDFLDGVLSTEIKYQLVSTDEENVQTNQILRTFGNGINQFDPIMILDDQRELEFKIIPYDIKSPLIVEEVETVVKVNISGEEIKRVRVRYFQNGKDLNGAPVYKIGKIKPTLYRPIIRKELIGRENNKRNFTFLIENDLDNPIGSFLPEKRMTSGNSGETFFFDPITLTEEGNFHFTISEVDEQVQGYSFDSNEIDLYLTVTSIGERFEIKDSYSLNNSTRSSDMAVFTNYYESGTLSISKTVLNYEGDRNFEFRFQLYDENDRPIHELYPCSGTDLSEIKHGDSFTLKDQESLTITNLPSGAKYIFEEIDLPPGFISTFENEKGVIIKDTHIKAACVNNYSAQEVTYRPKVRKLLIGDPPETIDPFVFELKGLEKIKSESYELPVSNQLELNHSESGEFDPITFKKAGVYNFQIKEVNNSIKGVTYDDATYYLTLNVVDEDSILKIKSVEYSNNRSKENSISEALFTNSYEVEPVTLSLKVKKDFIAKRPEVYSDFEFCIEEVERNNINYDFPENNKLIYRMDSEEIQEFEAITFYKAGQYQFKIREINTDLPGIIYDPIIWNCNVNVFDIDGVLEALVNYNDNYFKSSYHYATFSNSYITSQLNITKKVTGYNNGIDFRFKISFKYNEQDFEYPVSFKKGELTGEILSDDEFTLKADQTIQFELPFGTEYTVEELDETGIYLCEENNKGGKLEGNPTELVFNNVYNVEPIQTRVKIEKKIRGVDPPTPGEFNFILSDLETEKMISKIAIKGEGEGEFDPLSFDSPGIYHYSIQEEDHIYPGYSQDKSVWNYTVEVDEYDGKLVPKESYYLEGLDQEVFDKAYFLNHYSVRPVEFLPEIVKTVVGDPNKRSEFRFLLSGPVSTDVQLPEKRIISILGEGKKSFDSIKVFRAGNYSFSIIEIDDHINGYQYDKTIWDLNLEVIDNNSMLEIIDFSYRSRETTESLEKRISTHNLKMSTLKSLDKNQKGEIKEPIKIPLIFTESKISYPSTEEVLDRIKIHYGLSRRYSKDKIMRNLNLQRKDLLKDEKYNSPLLLKINKETERPRIESLRILFPEKVRISESERSSVERNKDQTSIRTLECNFINYFKEPTEKRREDHPKTGDKDIKDPLIKLSLSTLFLIVLIIASYYKSNTDEKSRDE